MRYKQRRFNSLTFIIIALIALIALITIFLLNYKNKEEFKTTNPIKIYVISLRREDRLENIKNQQSKINNNIEIFDAVKAINWI